MRFLCAIWIFVLASSLAAQDGEEVIPTGFPVTRYTEIWEDSPFNREVVKAAVTTIESSFAKTLVLEGIVTDDQRGTIAYVRDTQKNMPLVITSEKSKDHPYTVVSAHQVNNPEESKVTITDGKENGEIGFLAAKLTQAIAQPVAAAPARPPRAPGAPQQAGRGEIDPNDPNALEAKPDRPVFDPRSAPPPPDAIEEKKPTSVTPALDKLESEPRRRRIPLPGN